MARSYQALLYHTGDPPHIADAGRDRSLEIREETTISNFISRLFDGEGDIPEMKNYDLLLIAPDYQRTGQRGLGIEGAFVSAPLPIICLTETPTSGQTQHTHYTQTERLQLDRFDAKLPAWALRSETQLGALFEFVDAYQILSAHTPLQSDDILRLLQPPSDTTREQVETALPLPFTTGERTDIRYVARWIHQHLFETPGPLIRTERAAIRANLTLDAFLDRTDTFESAAYTGLFAEAYPNYWWKTEIDRIAFKTEFDVHDHEQPICITCGRGAPDRAAEYVEPHRTTIRPVHYKCSEIAQVRRDPYLKHRIVRPDSEHHETLSGRL